MFTSRIISLLTGIAFATIVTRNVSLTEYGVLQYITLLVSYFLFPNRIINYWVTRQIARQLKVAKTGLIMNLIFSLICCLVLLFISPYAAKTVNADPMLFMIGGLTLLAMYLVASFETVAQGSIPQINAYGFLTFEGVKVSFGVVTILYMKIGIYGALISVLIAYISQAIFLFANLGSYVTEANLDWNTVKSWLRTSWIPLYSGLASILISLDALIVTLLTSSTDPIGLWRAALMIPQAVGYSSLLTYALYPKLLAGGNEKDVETSLKLVLMFAVPSAIGAILLAEPLIRVFNPEFIIASNILRVGVMTAFLTCIGGILGTIIVGTEKIDKTDLSFKKLLKSRLFFLPTLSYTQLLIYLPTICITTITIINLQAEPIYLNITLTCNIIAFLAYVPIIAYMYRLAKKLLPFHFPITSLGKYLLASVAIVAIATTFHPRGAIQTITLVAISALVYFLILYAIDKDTRELFSQVISTFQTGDKKSRPWKHLNSNRTRLLTSEEQK